jgi:hypothetical protein
MSGPSSMADATSSDYQHLLATVMDWFEVE